MDTSAEFKEVLKKKVTGTPVTLRDIAVTIANDNQSLATYLVENDYKQLWSLLNTSDANLVIGENARMIPDKDRVAAELHSLIERKDWQILNYILQRFRISQEANNWTCHNDLEDKLREIDAIAPCDGTYCFKLQFA